ncbi:hypothetical protein BVRB_5g124420 [Beta vulgaris subsp. vulgaris]|nr:hypothetical protein BVRB_5g124420 [Beta vulgaris subsp. vulgaris]
MAARVEIQQVVMEHQRDKVVGRRLHGASSAAAANNNSNNTDKSGNRAKERGKENSGEQRYLSSLISSLSLPLSFFARRFRQISPETAQICSSSAVLFAGNRPDLFFVARLLSLRRLFVVLRRLFVVLRRLFFGSSFCRASVRFVARPDSYEDRGVKIEDSKIEFED